MADGALFDLGRNDDAFRILRELPVERGESPRVDPVVVRQKITHRLFHLDDLTVFDRQDEELLFRIPR